MRPVKRRLDSPVRMPRSDPQTGETDVTNDKNNTAQVDLGIVSQEELAVTLGVTKTTLREWRRLKTGPAFVRVGKLVFYRRQDVEEWLASNVIAPENVA